MKRLLSFIPGSVLNNHLNIINTYFFNCFPRLKWSLLDGWKTSTDGAVGATSHARMCHIKSAESGLQRCCWGSPGPLTYWEQQKCSRMMMGSDGWILQASFTSFCARQRGVDQQSGWACAWIQRVIVLLTSRELVFRCRSTSTPSIDPYSLKKPTGREKWCRDSFC